MQVEGGRPHLYAQAVPTASDTKDAPQGPTLLEWIVAGDPDVLAGYYDSHAAGVRQYCVEICSPELVDQAVLSAFTDFLGRARTERGSADDLLRKSTRAVAASRMQRPEGLGPTYRSVPELVAARANRELLHSEKQIDRHLSQCRDCSDAAQRLARAEDALMRSATRTTSRTRPWRLSPDRRPRTARRQRTTNTFAGSGASVVAHRSTPTSRRAGGSGAAGHLPDAAGLNPAGS